MPLTNHHPVVRNRELRSQLTDCLASLELRAGASRIHSIFPTFSFLYLSSILTVAVEEKRQLGVEHGVTEMNSSIYHS